MKRWPLLLLFAFLLLVRTAAAAPLRLDQVYAALKAKRYDEVEATYAELRHTRARDAEGRFLFESLMNQVYWYSSLDPKDEAYWPNIDASTQAWVAHSPKSHLAAMSRAFSLAYHAQAVQARGGSWDEVDRLAAEARRLMDGSKSAGSRDILWHAANLRVAAVEAPPRSDVRSMIVAGAALDPYPMKFWLEAAIALSPDGRDIEDQAWLMRLAAQRASGPEAATMYARVLDAVFWRFCDCHASRYGRAGIEWSLLGPSFEQWRVQFPAGYSVDLHAAMACLAGDEDVTARLLQEIGTQQRNDIWELLGGKGLLQRCRERASPAGNKIQT